MPDLAVTTALDKVRQYLGDDHTADRGASPDAALLTFMQAEYAAEWDKFARSGCVPPRDTPLSIEHLIPQDSTPGAIAMTAEPLAIVDVFELIDGGYRFLTPAQPGDGPLPFDLLATGPATRYAVYSQGAGTKIQLSPFPAFTGSYWVRYIPRAPQLMKSGAVGSEQSNSIIGLPDVGLDGVILRTARRALMARRESSPGLIDLIHANDADCSFHIAGRIYGAAPRIKNSDNFYRGWGRRGQDAQPITRKPNPMNWLWLT